MSKELPYDKTKAAGEPFRRLKPEEARIAARKMYVESIRPLSYQAIAKRVGYPRSVIIEWRDTYGWDIERASYQVNETNKYLKKHGVEVSSATATYIKMLKRVQDICAREVSRLGKQLRPDFDRIEQAAELGGRAHYLLRSSMRLLSNQEKKHLQKQIDDDPTSCIEDE